MIFRRRKVNPYRETLYAIYNVKQGINRIETLMDRISSRRRRMLEMTAQLEVKGETFLAKRYASEIAKLDKIYARLADLKLVLEKIVLSLEYALTIHNFRGIAREVLKITNELKKLPEATIPDIGLLFANLESTLRNLEDSTYTLPDIGSSMNMDTILDGDSERVLTEAREILKKKLESELVINDK